MGKTALEILKIREHRQNAEKKTQWMTVIPKKLPAVGIEPTLLAERDFESRASANSATPATEDDTNRMRTSGNHEIHTSA